MKSVKTIEVSVCCNAKVALVKEYGHKYWECSRCGNFCETKLHTVEEEVDTSSHDEWLKQVYPTGPAWTGD